MKNLNKLIILFLMNISVVHAVDGLIPIENIEMKLSNERSVITQRTGIHSHKIVLKQKDKVIWQKEYEEEYERLWDYAFFIPIKKNRNSYDLNQDGYPEIAIGTWDGGNNMANRTVLIFTVKKDKLEYFSKEKINLEYGKYVYP